MSFDTSGIFEYYTSAIASDVKCPFLTPLYSSLTGSASLSIEDPRRMCAGLQASPAPAALLLGSCLCLRRPTSRGGQVAVGSRLLPGCRDAVQDAASGTLHSLA